MDEKILDAIIQTESSGNPKAIGDRNIESGPSYGLGQIKRATAERMVERGMLPVEWNGKPVTKENVTEHLLDPEFNKKAMVRLYVDDKTRLRKDLKGQGAFPEEHLDELTIRSYNQGHGGTRDRDILGKKQPQRDVDDYLRKVKGNLSAIEERESEIEQLKEEIAPREDSSIVPDYNKPMMPDELDKQTQPEVASTMGFQDGGVVDSIYPIPDIPYRQEQSDEINPPITYGVDPQSIQQSPEPPKMVSSIEEPEDDAGETETEKVLSQDAKLGKQEKTLLQSARKAPSIDIQSEYVRLMDEYKDAKSKMDDARSDRAKLQILDALTKFGAQYQAGRVAEAGGFEVKAPKAGIHVPTMGELYKGTPRNILKDRMALLRQYQAATAKDKRDTFAKDVDGRVKLFDRQTGEEVADLGKARESDSKDALMQYRLAKLKMDEKREKRISKDRQVSTIRGILKDDPRFKKAMEQNMEFDAVSELIASAEGGNEQAIAALGTKMARAMGEVGVLTDTDVVRYMTGTSWGRKLKDWYKKGAEGELSPETLKDIKDNLKTLKGKLGADIDKVYDLSQSRIKAIYPELDNSYINAALGTPKREPKKVENGEIRRKTKDGRIAIFDKNKKFLRYED